MTTVNNRESGYTLLETLVALSLFVGVLIPVIGMTASLMLDNRTERLRSALREAQTSLVEARADEQGVSVTLTPDGLEVRREVVQNGRLVLVKVLVHDTKPPRREILRLQRAFVAESGSQ